MLKRLSHTEREGDWVSMAQAAWPVPFPHGLEYNSPAHGPWNIVHMGMQIPGAHQIYVCGANCVRGVVLTAAEMNAADRFSTLSIEEEDLFSGQMEEQLIDGVEEILGKLPYKPTVVLLFTVCVHHFMGCDIPYIYQELRSRLPDYLFVECYMDPIMQKEGLTPDQKLRHAMLSFLPHREPRSHQVSFLGSDFAPEESSEILDCLRQAGWEWKSSAACRDFEDYLSLSESTLDIVTYPLGQYGVSAYAGRMGHDYLYLPQVFSYEEVSCQMKELTRFLYAGEERSYDLTPYIRKCEQKAAEARNLIGETEIAIDMNAVPRYLGLARYLIEHGFHVSRLYGDSFSAEEEKDYHWLREHAPGLRVYPTIQARMRIMHGSYGCKVLAIGQKAAYFTDSPYFVNIVEGGGYHGLDGICHLLEDMMEAYQLPKDLQIISRKGWGCECCL